MLWSAKVLPPQPVLIQELLETTDHGVVAIAQTAGQSGVSGVYVIKMQQDGTFGWSRMLGKALSEFAYGACASGDNGIYLCGSGCNTFNYVMKLNANGDQVWLKDYNVAGASLSAQRILKTENGLLLAGRVAVNGDNHLYIARLDDNGQWLGGKMFAVDKQPMVKSFVQSGAGCVLAGQFLGSDGGTFVMKTDAVGNPTWFRGLQTTSEQSINAVAMTDDHSIMCIGNMFFNANENVNMWLTKLDPNGNLLWTTAMGSPELNGAGYDDLYDIVSLKDNRFMITGYSNGGLVGITDAAGNGFCQYANATVNVTNLPIQTQIFTPSPTPCEMFTSTVLSLASSYTTVSSPSVCYGSFTNAPVDTSATGTDPIENEPALANDAAESVNVNVYPNPTKGECNVDITNLDAEATLQLFDQTGRLVLQKIIPAAQIKTSLSLGNLPNGTYGISLKSNDWVYYQGQSLNSNFFQVQQRNSFR